MKATSAQVLSILVLLGLVSANAKAEEPTNLPEGVESQIRSMLDAGLITIDPKTNKATVHADVLKKLQEEGRLDVQTARGGETCGGGGIGGF
jgi:hypothetical protein